MKLEKMLRVILLLSYDVARAAELYMNTNQTTVADVIALECQDAPGLRSSLELAITCSSDASCRAIRPGLLGSSRGHCACPKETTWLISGTHSLTTIRLRFVETLPVPDVSFPMDEAMGSVVQGSLIGTMTSGASLVAGRIGNGLYTDGQTGHINYGDHHTECCQNPDMCTQGATFAMWIKRGSAAAKGIIFDTGAYEYDSKGFYVRFPKANELKISSKWMTNYDYYIAEWVSGQWLHLAFTWKSGEGIRTYLNGCDMDPEDNKGNAYSNSRFDDAVVWYPFLVGSGQPGFEDVDGTTLDELYIWYEKLNPLHIWQIFTQG